MVFLYEGLANGGEIQKGKIEAESVNDAKTRLKSQGISAYKISESKTEFLGELGLLSSSKIPEKKLDGVKKKALERYETIIAANQVVDEDTVTKLKACGIIVE